MKYHKGCTRIVFLIGNYAIKIPNFLHCHLHFLNGCYANYSERIFTKQWSTFEDENFANLYNLIVPTVWCSWFGLIQIQRRVKILDRELSDEEIERFKPISTDIKGVNYGFYQNRLVCVDYP